jgi:hypothetical protein
MREEVGRVIWGPDGERRSGHQIGDRRAIRILFELLAIAG